ncbi:type IV secretory system conjugative DNA transfer family protein [Neisseria zoodegmatis]|uniref:TraG n=1 Tax=Neisseria zoodegmatis TaxID=326523 RepID=A0AB38DSI7_9NEIS|nr:type IV secretory system conjugative DNA transfer family protein [Neisseria zoodegmatis]OSI10947.1 type IV secretory system conjugative DNA transfer family protein [Neisseria zoodegmatis]SNU80182.1 TraG [Neisseria zoodegmatis]
MSDTKKLPAVLFGLGLTPFAAAGGLYLASWLFTRWLSLKSAPSVLMLPRYWPYYDRLPENMVFPLQATSAIALLLAAVPLAAILAALFMKPKRELHGSARFANTAEIAKTGLLKPPEKHKPSEPLPLPSLLLGRYRGRFLRWVGNEFLFVAARTRAGKGVSLIIPNCLHYRDSMAIYDPKFENFLLTAGYRASVGQKIFLFNPGGLMPGMSKADFDSGDTAHTERLFKQAKLIKGLRSHRWNPFSYVSRNPLFMYKDISNMAAIMLPMSTKSSSGDGNSSFWVESARKLFVGLALFMLETEDERENRDTDYRERSTLSYLYRLTSPKNGKGLTEWIKDELDRRNRTGRPLSDACQTLLGGFASGNAKTNADILATMTAPLGIFLDPVVETATSGDDFRLDDLRSQRMTIYIGINPTETSTFSRLTNLFFSQLIQVNVAQGLPENNIDPDTGKTKLPFQCLLLMDEFPALGNVPAIMEGVSYVAGYGLRMMIIAQSPAQIEAVYGRENARTFFTNFAARALFTPRDQTEAEEYSKILGNETVKSKSVSRSRGKGTSRSQSVSDQKRALMYDSEIKQMPMDKCILDMAASRPIYADKIRYYDDPALKGRAGRPIPHVPELHFVSGGLKKHDDTPQTIPQEQVADTHPSEYGNKQELAQVFTDLIADPETAVMLGQILYSDWKLEMMPTVRNILAEDVSGGMPFADEADEESADSAAENGGGLFDNIDD